MGQAYVKEFAIVEERLVFEVVAQDTVNEAEFWVIDFQPYKEDEDNLPVNPDTGDILAENTGECSNVMPMGTFDSNGAGYYFSDDGNFISRNVSIQDAADANFKRLFSSYIRGSQYIALDQYGVNASRRDYSMRFEGNMGYFFNCTNTEDENIWSFANTTDSIEYRTTMHVTNVRPINPSVGTDGIGFVSSSIDLIYRLSRIAIANFVLSSSPLVRPVIDFVIVTPYFDEAGQPVTTKARIEIQFKTVIGSTPTDGLILYYLNGTETYNPENSNNSLSVGENFTLPSGFKECTFYDAENVECTQEWNFHLVLEVDDTVEEDDMPIDATGVFSFEYSQYICTDTLSIPPTGCVKTPTSPFLISMDITIQTVVFVTDSEKDYPFLYLLSITGGDGADLRGGTRAGSRGVNHLEPINMKIQLQPDFLRDYYDLELTLFMVCKEDQTDNIGGCLDVSTTNRYIAYRTDDFQFVASDENNQDVVYAMDTFDGDNWVPDGSNSSYQYLDYHSYDTPNKRYEIDFTNSALSQERLEYTITTIFRLVEKARRRRRRLITTKSAMRNGEVIIIQHSMNPFAKEEYITMPEVGTQVRKRRDIFERAQDPTGEHVAFQFAGCPKYSLYDDTSLACQCEDNSYYSTASYSCEKSPVVKVNDDKTGPSSADKPQPLVIIMLLKLLVFILYRLF
ncbi:uncharacterized protein LOC144438734 [Glandiceps talaboti]